MKKIDETGNKLKQSGKGRKDVSIQKFIIEGNPRGQGRPRATIRGRHASVYEAKEDTLYKNNITAQIVAQRPEYIEFSPIAIDVAFYVQRPKYHYNSKGAVKDRYVDDSPIGKPDLDNMLKALKDACNGIVWRDDAQIVDVKASKEYADTRPHLTIEVRG
jgi:Holliday junction resolvase RusA-like endonuclease